MPTLSFTATFSKNTGLLFSPQEMRTSYLYGIKMSSTISNQVKLDFSDDDIIFQVQAAQKEIENYLNIRLIRSLYFETITFSGDDWKTWGFIKTTYPVVCPLRLRGYLNTILQSEFPKEWLSSKKDGDDEEYHKQISIVPAGNTGIVASSVIYSGLLPNLGYLSYTSIPNFWNIIMFLDIIKYQQI